MNNLVRFTCFVLMLAPCLGLQAAQEGNLDLRLSRFVRSMSEFAHAAVGESIAVGSFTTMTHGVETYKLSWKRPEYKSLKSSAQMNSSSVAAKADEWIKASLPAEIETKRDKPLFVGLLCIDKENDYWIWVLEYDYKQLGPRSGVGFIQTLYIGITPSGAVISEVSKFDAPEKSKLRP